MQLVKRLVNRVVGVLVHSAVRAYYGDYTQSNRWHPYYALREDSLAETVAYIKANMSQAMIKGSAYDVLDCASGHAPAEGLLLEFGVRTGSTINHIARLHPTRRVHGFDSFEGLPERWSGWTFEKGSFGGEGIPRVDDNVELVIGWFDETLPRFLESNEGTLALAHIDSDVYGSARTVLSQLAPRIGPGSVIVFNEYFNYPNWKEHEYRAFQEFCRDHAVKYEYLCWGMYEVAVKIVAMERRA